MTKLYLTATMFISMSCLSLWSNYARSDILENKTWYINPMVSYIISDNSRNAENDIGIHIGLGTKLNPRWNFEVSAVIDNLDLESGLGEYKQKGLIADGLYYFDRNQSFNTFALIGAGIMHTNAAGNSKNNTLFNAGVGFTKDLTGNYIKLRTDLRYRVEMDNTTINGEDQFSDWILSVGIMVPIGSSNTDIVTKAEVMPAVSEPKEVRKDTDSDGVMDSNDKCPTTASGSKVDVNGCVIVVDSDKDGLVDSIDKCPETPYGISVDVNGCELDSDKDGVKDSIDRCPNSAIEIQVDNLGCEVDGDSDGVLDSKDKCPTTSKDVNVDVNGCELKKSFVLKGVNFVSNSDVLLSESKIVLDEVAATLIKNSTLAVEVAGYTDSRGDDSYNLSLSQRRAESVNNYLIEMGVNSNNLTAKGYGEDNAIADNSSREGRALNRRVELHILD